MSLRNQVTAEEATEEGAAISTATWITTTAILITTAAGAGAGAGAAQGAGRRRAGESHKNLKEQTETTLTNAGSPFHLYTTLLKYSRRRGKFTPMKFAFC